MTKPTMGLSENIIVLSDEDKQELRSSLKRRTMTPPRGMAPTTLERFRIGGSGRLRPDPNGDLARYADVEPLIRQAGVLHARALELREKAKNRRGFHGYSVKPHGTLWYCTECGQYEADGHASSCDYVEQAEYFESLADELDALLPAEKAR